MGSGGPCSVSAHFPPVPQLAGFCGKGRVPQAGRLLFRHVCRWSIRPRRGRKHTVRGQ